MKGAVPVSQLSRRLLALFLAIVLYLCLYPWQFDWEGPRFPIHWEDVQSNGDLADCLVNIFLFMPLGFLSALSLVRRLPPWAALPAMASAALLSTALEFLQGYIPGRNSNWRDVLCNAAGAGVGWVLARALQSRNLSLPATSGTLAHHRLSLFFTSIWLVWNSFPFLPVLRTSKFSTYLRELKGMEPRWAQALDLFAGIIILTTVFRDEQLGTPSRRALTVLLLAALFASGLVFGVNFRLLPFLGAVLAAVLSPWMTDLAPKRLAILMLIWLTARQVIPFTGILATPQPFSWVPFEPLLVLSRDPAVRILAGKFFLYTGTIWSWKRAGIGLGWATGSVLGVLAVTESVQRYLPGRTPELSDLVLALGAGFFLRALLGYSERERAASV